MGDLEKAILISFDESGAVDAMLKSQAVAYCQQIKESQSICSVCIEKLYFSNLAQVQFWCLQCLHEAIRARYSTMSVEEKNYIRKSVFSMICYEGIEDKNSTKVLNGPTFVKNKLAQVVVTLIYFEYPLICPSIFLDFLPHLNKGVIVIDMFSRVLIALDEELISFDYPRSAEEVNVSGRIKDAMRDQCISQIVRTWYDIISMYRNSDPDLCTNVLDSMRRYISWIDIGLVANETFTQLLFEILLLDNNSDHLRAGSASCILAMVSKRMDPNPKFNLLQSFQIRRVFDLLSEENDSDLISSVASLITGYATEVLECYKQLKVAVIPLLHEVLPSVFYIIRNCEVDTTFSSLQFLSSYINTMKNTSCSNTQLTETQLHHVSQTLEVIYTQIRYDPIYRNNLDLPDKIGKEEEEKMSDFRKDFFILLRNIGRVAPNMTQIFIRNLLSNAVASSKDRNVEEVEAALSIFYSFGESLTDEMMKSGNGVLGELIPMLLSTTFPCHTNRIVALIYLETITRYLKFVQENAQCIPLILRAFLDERGMSHPNIYVNRRASYLFMRVVKLLNKKLVPYLELILQSLQDTVSKFTNMNERRNVSGSEDGSYIFEAIGLLIGMQEVPPEKQTEYLSILLTPLCQQVEVSLVNAKDQSPVKMANIQQIVMAINALSKGFSVRRVAASPAIGLMFKQTLDVLLQILVVYPKIEPLRSKVTSFIHRMVEVLKTGVFPYLPKALEPLLSESQPKELVEFLVLLNQLIRQFNTTFRDILEEVYPAISSRIFNILPKEGIPVGPGGNTEEIRELQELQRSFYGFLLVIVTHDLSSVFLSSKNRGYLDTMMHMVLFTSCNHKDVLIRKACVQIFIRLIKDWCTTPNGEEKVRGFRTVIELFATNCCFLSVLDKSFEFRDANTANLFGEIVLAQKMMYERFGNAFLLHLVSIGWPQELADQYCQKLQGSDVKELKSFYQSLIENLRQGQNGSLVFR